MPIPEIKTPTPADIDIAQAAELLPVRQVAAALGLDEEDFSSYGKHLAKVHLEVRDKLAGAPDGKYGERPDSPPPPAGLCLAMGGSRHGRSVASGSG